MRGSFSATYHISSIDLSLGTVSAGLSRAMVTRTVTVLPLIDPVDNTQEREFGSFVTTLSFTYYYDHQATDGSKTGSQNIRGSKVGNSEGFHRRRIS